MNVREARRLALALPEATEQPGSVRGKDEILATLAAGVKTVPHAARARRALNTLLAKAG